MKIALVLSGEARHENSHVANFCAYSGCCSCSRPFPDMVSAQTYPTRPITIMVGAPLRAGRPTTYRGILTQHMRATFAKPIIIIENTSTDTFVPHTPSHTGSAPPGAAPDGALEPRAYGTDARTGAVYSLTYDVSKDFVPISLVSSKSW